jgi:hypothetical protein
MGEGRGNAQIGVMLIRAIGGSINYLVILTPLFGFQGLTISCGSPDFLYKTSSGYPDMCIGGDDYLRIRYKQPHPSAHAHSSFVDTAPPPKIVVVLGFLGRL